MAITRRLARFAGRHPRAVLLVFLLLVIGALGLVSRLRFDTDILRLLPQQDPSIGAFARVLATVSGGDELLVVVRIPEGAATAPYLAFADALAAELEGLGEIEAVDHRIGTPEHLLRRFLPESVLFLDAEGRRAFQRRLSPEGIRRRVEELRRQLLTPQGTATRNLSILDPLGLGEILLGRVAPENGGQRVDLSSGYYLSQDRTLLLLLARPRAPAHDLGFTRELLRKVEAAAGRALARWPEMTGGVGEGQGVSLGRVPPPPKVEVAGTYPAALSDLEAIRHDMTVGVGTAAASVLLLFLLAFRRLKPLVYAALPLAVGLLLAFAVASPMLGGVSMLTAASAALLLGLGVDFVIVSYGRFVEERRGGADLETALDRMAQHSGRAVVVGAVTTAATFYAFLVTGFPGLWQMGFLTGTGILLVMASVLLLLPALLVMRERGGRRRAPKLHLSGFGADRLVRLALHRPWTMLGAGLLITLGAAFALPRLEFAESMAALRPPGNRGLDVAVEVAEKLSRRSSPMMLVFEEPTLEETLETAARVAESARGLGPGKGIRKVESITDLVPPPEQQRDVLEWLARGRASGELDPQRVLADLRADLAAEGLRFEAFREGAELLTTILSRERPVRVEDRTAEPESRRWVDRFVEPTAAGWMGVVYLHPEEESWRRQAPPAAWRLAESLGPGVVLTGGNVLNERMRERITRDAWIAGLLGIVLVALLLAWDFRSLRDAVGALIPVLVGLVWMLGAMGWLGVQLNFLNTFVTTMILGIGVDYGLHMVHRLRETADHSPILRREGLESTARAVAVAALSTVCGFGSLALSSYPGLQSTGLVAIFGAVATALVSVTFLPAADRLLRG